MSIEQDRAEKVRDMLQDSPWEIGSAIESADAYRPIITALSAGDLTEVGRIVQKAIDAYGESVFDDSDLLANRRLLDQLTREENDYDRRKGN